MDEKDKKVQTLEKDVAKLKHALMTLQKRLLTQESRMSHVRESLRRANSQISNMQQRRG